RLLVDREEHGRGVNRLVVKCGEELGNQQAGEGTVAKGAGPLEWRGRRGKGRRLRHGDDPVVEVETTLRCFTGFKPGRNPCDVSGGVGVTRQVRARWGPCGAAPGSWPGPGRNSRRRGRAAGGSPGWPGCSTGSKC